MGPASRRPEPLAFARRTGEVIQQILTSQNVIFVNRENHSNFAGRPERSVRE